MAKTTDETKIIKEINAKIQRDIQKARQEGKAQREAEIIKLIEDEIKELEKPENYSLMNEKKICCQTQLSMLIAKIKEKK
jgi:hypothetical protein